ncbi:hypothetical protein QNI19_35325 [Cytophagaceae bacterium DM2B3-1]|uniref:HEPN domain-containing protein n=1 Tax=Xanthocytophaga flava TaxID=3048013 RepID=A0ABT7CXN2_9BACT|nr:hypothetical protein [Xanthocytophaga flavus]MDJ1498261.1 hypothetical protein [Xanthocytophaga flavus]
MENPILLHRKILTRFQRQVHEMLSLNEETYMATYPHLIGILASCIEMIKAFPHPSPKDKENALNKLSLLHVNIVEFDPHKTFTHRVYPTDEALSVDLYVADSYKEWMKIVSQADKALDLYLTI